MTVNHSIEFHDSTVHAVRLEGANAVIEMTVYVHSSAGQPGVDAGTGWYQPAEMVMAEAVLGQNAPAVPLDLDDGMVTVDEGQFESVVPLPFDRAGRVSLVLQGVGGSLRATGSRLHIVLKGSRGKTETFPGSAP
jgi:hypothetical protein